MKDDGVRKRKCALRMKNDGRERKIIKERKRKGVQRKTDVEKMKYRQNGEERDQKVVGAEKQ